MQSNSIVTVIFSVSCARRDRNPAIPHVLPHLLPRKNPRFPSDHIPVHRGARRREGGSENQLEYRSQMADEELIDPKKYLEERSQPKCVKPLYAYQECAKRIKDDESGHKHCTGQYFDYWTCVDKAVAPRLFEKLK